MRSIRYVRATAILVLLLGAAYGVLGWSQGPRVQGYEIAPLPLLQTVVAAGRVVTESRTQVSSELAGVVLERRVQEGDQVQPGDILLVLRADDIAAQVRQAEAALEQLLTMTRPQATLALENAQTKLAQAARETVRRRALAERSVLSIEALEQAQQQEQLASTAVEAASLTVAALAPGQVEEVLLRERLAVLQAQLAKTEVRAEVAGTVLTRNVEPGDLVQPGRVLFTIALGDKVEIRVPLDERNLSLLALQQSAVAVADAYPDHPFPARMTYIAPSIDSQRGTVEVRLTVDQIPEFLRQDMTVSVNIETGRREQALAVPNDALADVQGEQAQVMVLREGRVYRQQVTLGLRGLAMSEVLSGLAAGDRVLADPTAALADGARVRFTASPAPLPGSAVDSASRNEPPVSFD